MKNSSVRVWILASRPKTLWASVSPVIMGTAMAFYDGKLHWPSALVALLGSMLIQIGTNFANDYFDFIRGADAGDRLGPLRVTQAGLINPSTMKKAFIFVFLIAFIFGIYLIWRGGWPIFTIGVFSIIFGILYTGGPFPLGYTGLADIFVLIFFGPVAVGGTYYVQALEINAIVLVAGIAPGLLATAILTVNNLRDFKTDSKVGKNTLPVRFGTGFARLEYLFAIVVAGTIPIILVIATGAHSYSLASLIVIVFAIPSIKIIFSHVDSKVLNDTLANTGKLLFLYSIIFSVGWIL